ncbi:MAG: di-trans,poly-cis-decaprenylcistransferase [Thermoprotei archaeon]|nr:MAG: di-trans,poly-cis-decaprenylcistransferase [Thermoprotei archaeon]RLE89919.1 MAG: di-trans,poly-cis-decaprenylcistransferase [Thermoprotei archaeon]
MLRSLLSVIGIYKVYEKWLYYQVRNGKMPVHIAIILDGNRRWARSRGLPPWLGHEAGAEKLKEVLRWIFDLGIKIVTIYALSTENLNRDKVELEHLFNIAERYLRDMINSDILEEYQVRFKAIGKIELLPDNIRRLLRELEIKTEHYDEHYVNLAIAYGGRSEIVEATKSIVKEVLKGTIKIEDINEKLFEKYLFTSHLPNPSPDMIIRTSGEERLSNFLLWQAAYSELCFLETYWPDFRKIDLWRAIRVYQSRQRRFGR